MREIESGIEIESERVRARARERESERARERGKEQTSGWWGGKESEDDQVSAKDMP